jgi:hypothetical protein
MRILLKSKTLRERRQEDLAGHVDSYGMLRRDSNSRMS